MPDARVDAVLDDRDLAVDGVGQSLWRGLDLRRAFSEGGSQFRQEPLRHREGHVDGADLVDRGQRNALSPVLAMFPVFTPATPMRPLIGARIV